MTLAELSEPLFLYMCTLSRSARSSTNRPLELAQVKGDVLALMRRMQEQAAEESLSSSYQKLRKPLIYFVDSMIAESGLAFASAWDANRLAHTEDDYIGDEAFFKELSEHLDDDSADATERLEVFYICLGLGFVGMYKNEPERIRSLLEQIGGRIRPKMEADEMLRICPEAYKPTDRRELHITVGRPLGLIAASVVFLVCLAFVANGILYWQKTQTLRQLLNDSPFLKTVKQN